MKHGLVTLAVAAVLVLAPASSSRPVPGAWLRLPPAPFPVSQSLTGAWTGTQLIAFGRNPGRSPAADVAESYDPSRRTWTRLSPPPGPGYVPGYESVWTGREMLAFGAFHSVAYRPASGTWRELPRTVPDGIVVWTGREAIGWGGGCCGDARSNGAAYNAASRTFRTLARSPLAPSQRPIGTWTGRELIVLVGSLDPNGKPWPARLARAAAYDPATDMWRRIAPLPGADSGTLGTAAWDGSDLVVVGAGRDARSAFAYRPATGRWRLLAPLPTGRRGGSVVWTGRRLIVWGGESQDGSQPLNNGVAYDPRTNRWSPIPTSPLRARDGSLVAWTGRTLFVWGGSAGVCNPGCHTTSFADGAAFRPTAS